MPRSTDPTTPAPLAFAYDWRPREHARAIRRIIRERYDRPLFRVLRWCVYVLLVLAAAVGWAVWTGGDRAGALRLGILIVLVGGLVTGFPRIVAALRVWLTRRDDPNTGHPLRFEFGPGGVHVGGRTAETTLRWDGLHKVREDEEFLFFYYSRRTAYYLPKRVIGSGIDALRSTIREALPGDVPFESG